jgi:PST family polysaccharide transporter
VFWAYGSFVGGRLLTLAAIAILARLLTPAEFGIVALALAFMFLLEALSDLGVSQALVIVKEDEELEHAETVFVWSIVIGVLFSALTAATAPLAAAFFDKPELTGLLAVIGLRFFIRSLGATHFALAQKWIDFRSRTAGQIADVTTRGIASIAFAIAGFGAWSLVLGYLVGNVSWVLVMWRMVSWRPKLKPQLAHLKPMLSFGGKITGVSVLTAIETSMDKFFIGRAFHGAVADRNLGLYTIGFRLPELLIQNLAVVAGQVLFPAFAVVERAQLSRAFAVSFRYTLMVALPMAAGLAILADPLILALFGDQWGGAVPVMQVITLYSLAIAISIPGGQVLKATNRAGVLLLVSIPEAILLAVALTIFVSEGIVAVAWCMAVVMGLTALVTTIAGMVIIGVRLRTVWEASWAPLLATAGLAVVLLPIERAIDSPWPALVAGGVAGGLTYLALLWLFARESLIRLRDMALSRGGRREEPEPPPVPDALA